MLDSSPREHPSSDSRDKPLGAPVARRRFLASGLAMLTTATFVRSVSAGAVSEPQPAASVEATTHVVAPGDTLQAIALTHGLDVATLARVNGLANPNRLQVGQRLALSAGSQSSVPPPAISSGSNSQPPEGAIAAPYRSQFDGSRYADANCGPATLGMFLGHFGKEHTTAELRESANQQMNNWSADNGTSWEALLYAANVRGFQEHGLYASKGRYRTWTLDEVFDEVASGHPAMLLVRYKYLPGKESSGFEGNHYVLVLGQDAAGSVIYHDSAFREQLGAYRTVSRRQLLKSWSSTSSGINYSAMALHRIREPRGLLAE